MKLIKWILAFALIISTSPAYAAIAFLGGGNGGDSTCNFSASITIPASTNLLIIGAVGFGSAPTTATVGGSSATLIASQSNSFSSNTALFYFVNPPTGAQTVVTNGTTHCGFLWEAYSGAAITGVPDSFNTGQSAGSVASFSLSTTVVNASSWLVGIFADNTGVGTAGAGTVQRGYNSGFGWGIYDSNGTVGSGSHALAMTDTTGTGGASAVVASIAPLASASPAASIINLLRAFWW